MDLPLTILTLEIIQLWIILNQVQGVDWCSLSSGRISIPDDFEQMHEVFFSLTRDGGAWLRLGREHKSLDWNYVHEQSIKYQAHILSDADISLLNYLNYTDYCVLSDVDLLLEINTGWHPSYVKSFDPESKDVVVHYFKQKRDCLVHTNVTLTETKQTLRCDGGPRNSCGLKNLPKRGQETNRIFIKSATFDPEGENSWICKPDQESNAYTFKGSYYHAYVRVADCPVPRASATLGYDALLRAHGGEEENQVIITDPSQGALRDGWIISWKVFAKQVSPNHKVYLQMWRPSRHDEATFILIAQTFFHPKRLGSQEVVLQPALYFRVKAGDVLGLWFPRYNPVAYSSVPCADVAQVYRLVAKPRPTVIGDAFSFQPGSLSDLPCRQYSLTAVFANSKGAKLLDDWRCPRVPITAEDKRLLKGRETQSEAPKVRTETVTKPDPKLVQLQKRRHSKGPSIPIYIILVIIGVLVLLLVIVGFVSYYQAVKS